MKNQKSILIIGAIIAFISGVICIHSLEVVVKKGIEQYNKPDTTITIHNGVRDTIIIIKSL